MTLATASEQISEKTGMCFREVRWLVDGKNEMVIKAFSSRDIRWIMRPEHVAPNESAWKQQDLLRVVMIFPVLLSERKFHTHWRMSTCEIWGSLSYVPKGSSVGCYVTTLDLLLQTFRSISASWCSVSSSSAMLSDYFLSRRGRENALKLRDL